MTIKQTLLKPIASLAGWHASQQLAGFLRAHQKTDQTQQGVLRELIGRHVYTGFGRDHGFGSIKSYQDFVRQVPVTDYEGHRPYMDQVLRGQFNALLPSDEQVLMFSQTSGTTGTPKFIPVTKRFLNSIRRGWNIFGMKVLQDHPEGWLRPILQISSSMRESTSPTGLPCGAISGLLACTQKAVVRRMYIVPIGICEIVDPQARFYTILRCAIEKDVGIITTANPSSTIKLIQTGQQHMERLLSDLADGTYNPPGEVPAHVRLAMPRFRPNKAIVRRLEDGLKTDGKLLPRHYWRPAFLTNWTGGTLGLYLRQLRDLFGQVPIRDIGLLASEGRFTIPIADGSPEGLPEILGNFLEFIPSAEHGTANPTVLRAHQLEVGQEYFLVVTNWSGLWRYNMDDRVRVTQKYHDSPVFEFLSRGRHTANITGEKITEHQVVEAMRQASGQIGASIQRFVLQGRFAPLPYYELRLEAPPAVNLDALAEYLDQALAKLNVEYQSKRKSERLGAIRAVVLPPGTLEQAELQAIVQRRGRSEQYKHQYLLTNVLPD